MAVEDLAETRVGSPLDVVADLVESFGTYARPLRHAIALLTETGHTVESLVVNTTLPRRTVDRLVRDLGDDVSRRDDAVSIRTDRVGVYRERFDYDQLRRTPINDLLAERLAATTTIARQLRQLVTAAPGPLRALDQVPATAATILRRGLWMDSTYDLSGARLLCVGDHDLTSLGTCLVNREVQVTVVDLDERLLAFIDTEARRRGLDITCRYADLRFGLPSTVATSADLAFTDPPYTPEGARLFLTRAAEGLRDRTHGRLLMAYGFGEQPALGLKVQQAIQTLHLATEAILPSFNTYDGAQAIGGTSDLYVCRPTAKTWRALDSLSQQVNIYTHGSQALERRATDLTADLADEVLRAAEGERRLPATVLVGHRWPRAEGNASAVPLTDVLDGSAAARLRRTADAAVAVDLTDDPGGWLLRVLLAVSAERLVILAAAAHFDLVGEDARRRLAELVEAKWTLRVRSSTQDPKHTIVEADLADASTLSPGLRTVRWVLDRAHAKLANAWREGLIDASGERRPLSKNEARAIIENLAAQQDVLTTPVIELPRHTLREVIQRIITSADEPAAP